MEKSLRSGGFVEGRLGYSKHNFFFRLNDTVFISGIEGEIFKVITNMYNGIKSCITINGASSGYFTCEKVVRRWGGGEGGGGETLTVAVCYILK